MVSPRDKKSQWERRRTWLFQRVIILRNFPALLAAILIVSTVTGGCGTDNISQRSPRTYGYRVVARYHHDSARYTQGLVWDQGFLYESTGLRGRSMLVKSEFPSGREIETIHLDFEHFGEGITILGEELFQLTYTSHIGFVYDKRDLQRRRTFSYATEGWGLTDDERVLIMSDGTAILRFIHPVTFDEIKTVTVADGDVPVANLNELEYVEGLIYANVWKSERVAVIHSQTGEVVAWLDLGGLNPDPERLTGDCVLNGIAYHKPSGHFLVTGKCWPEIYEIEIVPR